MDEAYSLYNLKAEGPIPYSWVEAVVRIQTVVPGHGPVSTLEQVSRLKGYVRDLRERVGELARGGLRREEILSHPGFPRYAEKAYAANHQRNIWAVYDELFSQPSPS